MSDDNSGSLEEIETHSAEKMKILLSEVLLFIDKLKAQPLPPLELVGVPSEEIQEYMTPGKVFSLEKITRFFEFIPILDQIRHLNMDYPTVKSLVESGNYTDAFQMIIPLVNDFQQALALTLPKIKDEEARVSLMKFITHRYVPAYLLAGITSGLSGNLNFVLSNFAKSIDLLSLFLSTRREFFVEAQYLLARAMTALQHIPQGKDSPLARQSIFRLKQAITCFRNTLRLAEEFNLPWLQIQCLIGIADAYFDLRLPEEAEYILEDAIERVDDKQKDLIDLLLTYGDERYRLGDIEIAPTYFSKASDVAFALCDLKLISKILSKHGYSSNIDEFIEQAIELAEEIDRREFVVHFKLLKERRKIPQKPFKYSFKAYMDINELPDDLKTWMVYSRAQKIDNNAVIICWNGKIGSNLALYDTQDKLKELLALKSLRMIKLDEGEYMVKDAPDNLKEKYRIHALIHPGTDAKISVKTEQETFVMAL
ncbi:MAG: hypothetical protein ACFFCD_02325 [Promethearchaeota archaeon]